MQVNAKAIIEKIVNKTSFNWFFILYDNINFDKHVQDQQLHSRSIIVNNITGYICIMKIVEKDRKDNT